LIDQYLDYVDYGKIISRVFQVLGVRID